MLVYYALVALIIQFSFGANAILEGSAKLLATNSQKTATTKLPLTTAKFTAAPELKPNSNPLSTQAQEAIVYDVASGKLLYAKNTDQSTSIASLTKLMTALTILQSHSPNEMVTIPSNLPALSSDDQKIGVIAGEKFKLSELMKALLIYSANDVANSLAIWDACSVEAFSSKMNQNAEKWGLRNSHFVNPNGLDQANHYSSAADILVIANVLLHNQDFKKIVNTQSTTITNTAGKSYLLTTTNKDLSLPYVYGIKTGFTELAGQCLILLSQKNGHEIITIVLNSPDRFQESKNMVEYTFNNYVWK
jgi:D-alanyl-D-alanine carboxypeptidase